MVGRRGSGGERGLGAAYRRPGVVVTGWGIHAVVGPREMPRTDGCFDIATAVDRQDGLVQASPRA